jgi:CRP-like cAMP-binding protein
LLQQRPAIASVVTLERSFLLRLPDRYFMEVLMMHPALMEHVATLGATRAEQNARLLRQGDRMLDDHVALF